MSTHNPKTDPPGAVSDQNGEEAQSALRKDGEHPEPRTKQDKRSAADEEDATDAAA